MLLTACLARHLAKMRQLARAVPFCGAMFRLAERCYHTQMSTTLRVAAAQFATGTDVDANLTTTLRMVEAAAAEGAQLVVLPEFCNHLSVYDDDDHAWQVAITLDGDWVEALGDLAARRGMWVQANATVRRAPARQTADGRPHITNSNLVFAPDGRLATVTDKTVLMGAESDHLRAADRAPSIVDTPYGPFGSYACMDGIVPEVPRVVAASGARVLMNSLNSFALDEASLHIPVRAAENRAWVVACCKVGPLLPADKVAWFSEHIGVPAEMLDGAGESQIVAPDGQVVARGPRRGEAVVCAEIDLDRRGQLRPDGTDVWASRRPHLYRALAEPTPGLDDHPRAQALRAAATTSIDRARELVAVGVELIVLPELAIELDDVAAASAALEGTEAIVVTSVREGNAHVGLAIAATGVIGRQPQLHAVARHDWDARSGDEVVLGDAVVPIELPWGRLAIVVGDDLVHPEVSRLAALASVDVLAVPLDAAEPWETALGVLERAAENRVCVVAATPTDSAGESTIADLPPDFTLWASSRERPFAGTINLPDVHRAGSDGTVTATIHPDRAVHRQISKGTNLVDGRPWAICGALSRPPASAG